MFECFQVGHKKLFLIDNDGKANEMIPKCVLDFYIAGWVLSTFTSKMLKMVLIFTWLTGVYILHSPLPRVGERIQKMKMGKIDKKLRGKRKKRKKRKKEENKR